MKLLFWSCASLIVFAYSGYPICMYFRARFWPRPVLRASIYPRVTIVLVVHNEEKNLPGKLVNLADLDYPADSLDMIIVSDGSTDETNRIVNSWQKSGRRAVILPERRGKANGLNHGMAEAQGEIICFTDARQRIGSDSLRNLVSNFADPSVGCASGELVLRDDPKTPSSEGVGLYWRLEKNIRNWEGLAGSTVGATGAFYAVRKDLLSPVPEGAILDDIYIPLQVARKGRRIIFDPRAVVYDDFKPSFKQEFRRKVRTLAGTYELLLLAPWVLTNANPLRLRLICHRLLRLLVPFGLMGVFVSSLWLRQGIYELALVLQLVIYSLAALSMLHVHTGFLSRMSNISLAFILLNTAAAVAFVYFITGKKAVWTR
jgi:biofilm PGA synthesis N-glycosyltransferase PgaC